MFRRIRGLCLLLILTALLVLPVLAQNDWFVLLYNSMTKEFLRVNLDGTQETYNLDLPEDVFVSAREMAFSPDGNHTAFCLIDYAEQPSNNKTTLVVRDLVSGTNILEHDLGTSIGCRVTGNEDFSQFAVALIRSYAGDPNVDPNVSPWELLAVDTATGETLYSLNRDNPLASSLEYRYGESFLPYVMQFLDSAIVFGEVPYGTEFPPDFPTYSWQPNTNTLEPAAGWGYPFSDRLTTTGELTWLDQDESLPAGEPMGPIPANNIVNVTDANGETKVVYHNPEWYLSGVQFMEGGERLLLQLGESFDPNNPNEMLSTHWLALDRQGIVAELYSTDSFATLEPAPGGYLIFDTMSKTLPATYTLEYHGEGGIETLLTLESDQYGAWEIAYVPPSLPVADLPPFTAITP